MYNKIIRGENMSNIMSFPLFIFLKEMVIIPRIARNNLNTPFLHVMVQGVNKEYIFYKKEYIEKYLNLIKENLEKYDLTEFGKFMHAVNLNYSRMYNREENRCGVLFRNRYQAEPIYNQKYLINCIKYIHENPVKANIVGKSEDYKYSSVKDYLNNTGATQSKIMKEIFGENFNFKMMLKNAEEKYFLDVEQPSSDEIRKFITNGISEFLSENSISVVDILSDRRHLKDLIVYLNECCNIKYKDIQAFLEVSRNTICSIKCY
jgi:hypothetical protein